MKLAALLATFESAPSIARLVREFADCPIDRVNPIQRELRALVVPATFDAILIALSDDRRERNERRYESEVAAASAALAKQFADNAATA